MRSRTQPPTRYAAYPAPCNVRKTCNTEAGTSVTVQPPKERLPPSRPHPLAERIDAAKLEARPAHRCTVFRRTGYTVFRRNDGKKDRSSACGAVVRLVVRWAS